MKIVVIVPHREEFVACEVIKGLYRMGVEVIPSSPLNKIRDLYARCSDLDIGASIIPDSKIYSDNEIIEHSQDADYIMVLWSKFISPLEKDPGGKMYLVDKINMPDKTILIDGSEWSYSGYQNDNQRRVSISDYSKGIPWIWLDMRNKVKWYFKRETYPEDVVEYDIIPFPYPFRVEDRQLLLVESVKKDIGLFCGFGQTSTGLRKEVMDISNQINSDYLVTTNLVPNRKRYLERIVKSFLVADAWGGGDCTVRRQEVHMNSTALIMQKWGILNPYPFTDGKNVIHYDTAEEFKEKSNYYLKNVDKLIEIGKQGYEHSMKHHITEKRLEYMFDIINKKIKWDSD